MSNGLRKCSKRQLKLYRVYLTLKKSEDQEKYKQYRNTLKGIKRKARRDFYYKQCMEFKRNTKKLWQMINNVSGKATKKQTCINSIKIGKIEESNKQTIVNTMCKHFTEIGMTFARNTPASTQNISNYLGEIKTSEKSIYLNPTDPEEIVHIINNLANKNSCGWDGISNKLLKGVKHVLCKPLSVLFNRLITSGIFPNIYKNSPVMG